jgi:cellulose synthase/poly-beta-1,6-N-acetylglucosamine synthase-like glycosyltransferase
MNTLEIAAALVLWISAALVVYSYLGYPLLIRLLAGLFGRPTEQPPVPDADLPSVSLLIAAYNEAAVIEERIRNALAMDYPANRREIVVASDGCSDATPTIVRRYADQGIRLLDYPERRGKATVLNAAFTELKGDIVLLSDANTNYDPSAARCLVRWFRDPKVGAVCGRLVLTDPETGRNADSLYWKYETFLKLCEGRLGALLGANGAIYALRRDQYVPIPGGTLVDDFVIPLLAKLRTGCAIIYDREAVAREETPAWVGAEFHRRSRIGAGGFQSVGMLWGLLDPRRGWVAFTFFSHKILRWLCPFFLLAMLLSNCFLLAQRFYWVVLGGQVAFYALSAAAAFVPARYKLLKPLRLTTLFTGMNLALLVGFGRWLRGIRKGAWRRTERTTVSEPEVEEAVR